ncbi:MAG: hypothetical protein EOP62_13925 [Sphingomonadales bacterium]|nr:MAG: hypothetical protein EOP62_13925 [Sphingomonadales bacterium]
MHAPTHGLDTRIYVRIAALCLGINITGFGLNAALGHVDSSALSPILYIHALLFIAWSILAVVQPSLVARGNRMTHRKLGWAMTVLAVAMGVSGLWITVSAISAGRMAPANIFMMINILTVSGFLGLVAAALVFRREMAWHSRLMTSATILLTGPAWARILPMDLLGPAGLIAISACVLALSAWGMVQDRRNRGRVHPAWWWGASVATLIGPLSPPLAFIPAFADWAARI